MKKVPMALTIFGRECGLRVRPLRQYVICFVFCSVGLFYLSLFWGSSDELNRIERLDRSDRRKVAKQRDNGRMEVMERC